MTGNVRPSVCLQWLCMLLLLCSGSGISADENMDEIPAGFENLDAPKETEIEIWFAGKKRGTTFARFSSQWIIFRQPQSVANMIPEVRNKAFVAKSLNGQLAGHGELVCRGKNRNNCGILHPKIAGVILDHRRFRATVFINPEHLKIRTLTQQRYLNESSSDISAVQGLSLNLSGARSRDSTDHYSWYGRSLMALKENHLLTDWSYDKKEHFSVSSLYIERDWQGQELIGGLFGANSFGLGFSADPQLLGVRLAHSTDSLSSQSAVNNTPLIVYLPVRGRVEIYRAGKLLKAELLEAGRQQLDTRSLPQGAYNLTIRVYDGTQLLNEQQVLYVKSNSLPGDDDPQYFFEIGRPVENVTETWWPQTGAGWVARGGYSQLLTETSSFTLAATVENSDALAEAGILNLSEFFEFSGGVMMARESRKGFYGNAVFNRESWQLQARYRELSEKKQRAESHSNNALLGEGFRTGQLDLSKSFGFASVEVGRDWQRSQSQKRTQITDHIRFEWPLLKDSSFDMRLTLDASSAQLADGRNSQVLASLTLTHREGVRTATVKQNRQENKTQGNRNVSLTTRASARWQKLEAAGQTITAGGYLEKQRQQDMLGGDAYFAGKWLGGQVALNRSLPEQGHAVTNYTGSFSTSALARPDNVSIGGGRLSDSAVLVAFDGDGEGYFDILVNGKAVTYGRAGEVVPIVLTPFRKYGLSIKARGNNFSDYDDTEQSVTLYPGNVARVSFSVVQVFPVLGRLYDTDENILDSAIVENVQEPVLTDSHGIFQARVRPTKEILKVQKADGTHCEAVLPEKNQRRIRRGVTLLGRLICNPTDSSVE
ncbi:TcfC E-set like domain-containing protein [Parendozoicomonas sp. Alg238-R29]|uniref:TcfC E-set like domain-containing protein n=1 Tax=Parendozoicomonas sp. Alg238-R29 TaxID=2993446 RepID=UPI00248D7C4A|nr:TcfC E-set like domain-containing protein [Parendozoicomonas sp. Alg238-R29]